MNDYDNDHRGSRRMSCVEDLVDMCLRLEALERSERNDDEMEVRVVATEEAIDNLREDIERMDGILSDLREHVELGDAARNDEALARCEQLEFDFKRATAVHTDLQRQIDDQQQAVGDTATRVATLAEQVEGLQTRVNLMAQHLQGLSAMPALHAKLAKSVEGLQARLEWLENPDAIDEEAEQRKLYRVA